MFAKTSRLAAWALAALLPCGCFVEASNEPPPPLVTDRSPGRLTLRWSIDEVKDPNVCVMGQASDIDITVVSATSGTVLGEFQAPCSSFSTTVSSLLPGRYRATARLLDGGEARTTAVPIDAFTIVENSNLIVDIDFPADSFN